VKTDEWTAPSERTDLNRAMTGALWEIGVKHQPTTITPLGPDSRPFGDREADTAGLE
jgi:hypothetical protein